MATQFSIEVWATGVVSPGPGQTTDDVPSNDSDEETP